MAKSRWAIGQTYVEVDPDGTRHIRRVTRKTQAHAKAVILAQAKRVKETLAKERKERSLEANARAARRRLDNKRVNARLNELKTKGITKTYAEVLSILNKEREQRIKNIERGRTFGFIKAYNDGIAKIREMLNNPNIPEDVKDGIRARIPWNVNIETELTIDDVYTTDYYEILDGSHELAKKIGNILSAIQDLLVDIATSDPTIKTTTDSDVVDIESILADVYTYGYATTNTQAEYSRTLEQMEGTPITPTTEMKDINTIAKSVIYKHANKKE